VAVALRARGHLTAVVTSEHHRRTVEATGVAFHAMRPDLAVGDKARHRRLIDPKRGLERVVREVMLPALRDTYADLRAAVEADGGADLLISQLALFAAPLVAEATGVPWVSSELQPGAFISAYDPPVLAPLPGLARLRGLGPRFHRALFGLAALGARRWAEPIHALRRELGLRPCGKDPILQDRHSPRLVLALFSACFAERQPDWPPQTEITGFPFWDEEGVRLAPELERFLDADDPPIVFTLGSSVVWDAGRFYLESAAVARRLGRRAVLLIGDDPDNRLPGSADVAVVPYAEYGLLRPRACVVVHHGGVGTTGQTLRAGKPALVVPYGGDQFDNGARVERLGAGRMLRRRDYATERVAAELQTLLESDAPRRAGELGRRIAGEDGVGTACDVIERQLPQPRRAHA
jgi:UDP:flavonoid glycosyltransferase YjiC (YdhE family)